MAADTATGTGLIEEAVEALAADVRDRPPDTSADLLGRRFDAGLAWVDNAPGQGGLGLPSTLQQHADDLLEAEGLLTDSDRRADQRGLFGPVLNRGGTAAQRDRYLRSLYTHDEIWCLLLSEPDAGSDLGNISTRAVQDGDTWVVNGQKIWTSMGHKARRGLLLALDDTEARRFKGFTAFVVDMDQPGVEVRPIRQMSGDAEFNEVFFTDATVADDDRVGDRGSGWGTVMGALATQRFIIGNEVAMQGAGPISDAMAAWKDRPSDDPVLRDRLAALWIRAFTVRLYARRLGELAAAGHEGDEPSVLKLLYTELIQDVYEFTVDVAGAHGMTYPDDYEMHVYDEFAMDGHDPRRNFLAARGRTIGGGSSQILRTALGERTLGLPREPR